MLTCSLFTNPGTRLVNEDYIGYKYSERNHCFVVCDGLGGHGMGDRASQHVVKTFMEAFESSEITSAFLGNAFMLAQKELLDLQRSMGELDKMKTTAAVLLTDEKYAYCGHIGDTRLYVFSNGKIKMRTHDHSVPEALVRMGKITEDEIRFHPDRNRLIRVMGNEWNKPMYEIASPLPLEECQAFLLCTDGFWELISENDMCSLLNKSDSADEWMKSMVNIVSANANGKKSDNYSAIAIWNF